jgi:hypothetical protein
MKTRSKTQKVIPHPIIPLRDTFSDEQPAGKVIGTINPSGVVRKGVDVERAIAIDNGALRFQPLVTPGWGRQGIAYGSYTRANGLAFAVFLLNGHNTSQAGDIGQKFFGRLWRWLRGSETENPALRLLHWLGSKQKQGMLRRLFWWASSTPTRYKSPHINENLAVGWFNSEVPLNPLVEGSAFVVHATGAENGELWANAGGNSLPILRGWQNIPTYYIVILREQGAAYYAASVPKARGLVAYPNMRPVAIDPFGSDRTVYAGLYQSVLGQIGFRVDTRVYGVHVEQIAALTTWYGTAHAADDLIGDGWLDGAEAEIGGCWRVWAGNYKLTANGAVGGASDNLAILNPDTTSGLIHTAIETTAVTSCSIVWRFLDRHNYWDLFLESDRTGLRIQVDGEWQVMATDSQYFLQPHTTNSVQILDDGETFSLYLNGKLLFGKWFTDPRLQSATGIGMSASDSNSSYRYFEAHPRSIPIPKALDLGVPWVAEGSQTVATENFVGVGDLSGKTTSTGGKIWRKDIGKGAIALTENGGAAVRASVQNPNPGRTAYTISWDNPNFVDLQVKITPPGTERGQQEKGRGGLIFWQDANNYITISTWLDDVYGGASMSSFFHLNGFEEIYDAVWSNVGSRIYWGIPYTLRVVFDGMNFTTYINDEPVLYRALTDVYPNATPLAIARVGIVANWEWGNDTGSRFENFVAQV